MFFLYCSVRSISEGVTVQVLTDETSDKAGVPGNVLVPRLISGTTDPIFSENALITVDELL